MTSAVCLLWWRPHPGGVSAELGLDLIKRCEHEGVSGIDHHQCLALHSSTWTP
jgi:hypothetical protein